MQRKMQLYKNRKREDARCLLCSLLSFYSWQQTAGKAYCRLPQDISCLLHPLDDFQAGKFLALFFLQGVGNTFVRASYLGMVIFFRAFARFWVF